MEEPGKILESDVINRVLNSDSSLDVLLTRLKQSITTGEELSKFVRKKAQIEDEHYTQLKKFASNTRMSIKTSSQTNKIKQDLFLTRMDQIIEYDEKLHSVGSSYVTALNIMYDELTALVSTVSRSRKLIKDDGKRKEKECSDAVLAAEKAKQKYYHLCEDLEKLKTSDPNKKSFSLKNKTVEQQEDELQRKVDLSDQDYKLKVSTCKKLKDEILVIHRPTNSKKLKNLILEMDIAMNVQLQKYATWNENLIMNSGVLIAPLKQVETASKPSMKDIASSINNEKDLFNYLVKFDKLPTNKLLIPVEYVVHPSLNRGGTGGTPKPFLNNNIQKSSISGPSNFTSATATFTSSTINAGALPSNTSNAINTNNLNNNINNNINTNSTNNIANSPSSFGYSSHANTTGGTGGSMVNSVLGGSTYTSSMLNPGNGNANPVGTIQATSPKIEPVTYSSLDPGNSLNGGTSDKSMSPHSTELQPTFGVSIETIIQFAGIDNVPMIVKKCIDVLEAYGINIEGIYRASGNVNAVTTLKDSIDSKFTNYLLVGSNIDPGNVIDTDIFTVASLLKLYVSSLPEPLLTNEYYQSFIETVKSLDETYIAKKLHHLVYNLPDGAYFTLRALIFHLNKVAANEDRNRMSMKNLAIIWGPVIMNDNLLSPQDIQYKSKVVEELMLIANEIFEAD